MSVQFDSSRSRWVVRWYDAGRQRCRRFPDEQAARAFDADRARAKKTQREVAATALADELAGLRIGSAPTGRADRDLIGALPSTLNVLSAVPADGCAIPTV